MPFPPPARQLDFNGGAVVSTEQGPAVLVPLAWLTPGLLARVCADRCLKRMGAGVGAAYVVREAERLMGECRFTRRTAERVLVEIEEEWADG